jgi:hypothetical protein
VGIFSNEEILHYQADRYPLVQANGNNDINLTTSYMYAMNSFVNNFKCSMVYPWIVTDKGVLSYRWYIVLGKPKLEDNKNRPFYTLADNSFLNWLFIDDHAGNITNHNGLLFRYDAMRSKNIYPDSPNLFLHSDQIKDTNGNHESLKTMLGDYNVLACSADYAYGPKDSAELNKSYHVYTGDIMPLSQ